MDVKNIKSIFYPKNKSNTEQFMVHERYGPPQAYEK